MIRIPTLALAAALFVAPLAQGQANITDAGDVPAVKTPWFVDPARLPLASLIPSPPAADSAAARNDLAEVHRVEQSRTPAEVKAAQYDDTHEDIFIFANVLGDAFNAERLPKTALLSAHLRNDAGIIDNPLKQKFGRLRPYNFDTTLHPVCETNKEASYPSGHSINGYLYAFTLAEVVPEQHDAILRRADEYAHNRVVCGSHYVTDTQASRQLASFIFGYLLANPRFQEELDSATLETRQRLHFAPLSAK
jgi:acid phosphatase (class A)